MGVKVELKIRKYFYKIGIKLYTIVSCNSTWCTDKVRLGSSSLVGRNFILSYLIKFLFIYYLKIIVKLTCI